jgi:predicted transcriptional regulator
MKITKKNLENIREKQALLLDTHYSPKRIYAKDIMIMPTFLYLDDDIESILRKLRSEEINYCVVVDEKKQFIWEVTDEMLLNIIAKTSVNEPLVKILDIGYKRGVNYSSTKDYVKRHKNVIAEDTPLYDIMMLIHKKWFQFIPVVNKEKKVIWLITPSSILKFIIGK